MSIPAEKARHEHPVEVTVNNQRVIVQGPKATGLEIKEDAIAQGVQIEVSFILSEIRPNDEHHIMGNDDEITVHPGSKFVAVADDDNS